MECISPPLNPHMPLERRLYASVEPATGSEPDFPDGTYAAQQGPPDTCRAAFVVLGHGSLRSRHDRPGCGRPQENMGPRRQHARPARFLFHGGGRHRYGFGGLPDRPFRAQAHPALGRLHLHVLYIDRQPLRKPRVDSHHALHRRARGRGRLPSPLPDAFRNRPGQAPRHPRLHLQRHPDGLLSASDALRLVGHQQFFAGRRVARAVHRGRAPHRHDLFPAPLAPRIPALADAARTP